MPDSGLSDRASRRTEDALSSAGMADPRPLYRELLRSLQASDGEGFAEATERFQSTVLPAIAGDESDPVNEWIQYGRWLATRSRPGRFVSVDATGRATDPPDSYSPDDVLLHIPDEAKRPVYLLASPSRPSPAQQATVELLVRPASAAY